MHVHSVRLILIIGPGMSAVSPGKQEDGTNANIALFKTTELGRGWESYVFKQTVSKWTWRCSGAGSIFLFLLYVTASKVYVSLCNFACKVSSRWIPPYHRQFAVYSTTAFLEALNHNWTAFISLPFSHEFVFHHHSFRVLRTGMQNIFKKERIWNTWPDN